MKRMNSKSDDNKSLIESVKNVDEVGETKVNIEDKLASVNFTTSSENNENFQYFTYDSSRVDLEFLLQKLKWSFSVFCLVICVFYVINASFFNYETRQFVFHNLEIFGDWRLLTIIVGVYVTFAFKKAYEVSNHLPVIHNITSLIFVGLHIKDDQKLVMKYLCTSIASAFSHLSPMVKKRFSGSKIFTDKVDKRLLNLNADHFTSIKLALDVIQESRRRGELDEKFLPQIVAEVNSLQNCCDRLISFKYEKLGKPFTLITMFYICSYFTMSSIFIGGMIKSSVIFFLLNSLLLLMILAIVIYAEQHIKPFDEKHDVFRLNRCLNRQLEKTEFVLGRETK